MKKTSIFTKILCVCLASVMLFTTPASAVSISAVLASNTSCGKVTTTFNSGKSGYHYVVVNGYEYHSGWGEYRKFSGKKSSSGGGTMSVNIYSSVGCTFKLKYNGVRLSSSVYYNTSTLIGKVYLD